MRIGIIAFIVFLTPYFVTAGAVGEGSIFEITDSDYLNINLESTEVIKLRMESVPEMITMRVAPTSALATSTQITITGFLSNTTYYKYEDNYHNLAEILSDENGAYSYTQDISKSHRIFIQPRKSTKFISNNATGGDCASIGTWDPATLTCTLATDLTETVQIDSDGITLDGSGHAITGSNTGNGIYLYEKSGVTIKNLIIKNFSYGITFDTSSNNSAHDNSVSVGIMSGNRYTGEALTLYDSNTNEIYGNTFSKADEELTLYTSNGNIIHDNEFSKADEELTLYDSNDNEIYRNTFSNTNEALTLYTSNGNIIYDNTFSEADEELTLYYSNDNIIHDNTLSEADEALTLYNSSDNIVYNNNFINNSTHLTDYNGVRNIFNLEEPVGGNYFDTFDEPAEGCDDTDLNGFCDAPYVVYYTNGQDALPWTKQNGWEEPPDPCAVPGVCSSNVLFLPGIEGSRLYRPDYAGGTDQLWEPNADSDVQDLYMNADGTSVRFDVYAKEGDVLDELPSGANIYKSFIVKMNDLKTSGTITDWEPIAYDWRLSLDDILNYGNDVQGRIYYSGDLRATSTPYVIQELKRLAAASKTGKVTIVAHSNGGLLAKRLTEILGPTESARFIDKMIFVAVPQAGTPAAIPAGLHGYEQDHILGLVTSKSTARTFAQNSPMEYQLLPSAQYFTYVDDPVVTFDASLTDWISRYGATIHSEETLHSFLIDSYGRVNAQTGDINQPIQFNSSLLSNAETLHTSLDNWTAPAGVQLIQIAGWGVPKTVKGTVYKKKGTGVTPEASFTIDGDGTVVAPSALWTSTTTGAVNYWVDLKSYNRLTNRILGLRLKTGHSSILEVSELLTFITDNLTHDNSTLPQYISTSIPDTDPHDVRLRYALHSPLTLNLYDDEGRHTGVSTSTGQVEEQIPGTYYTEFGDVKYLFSDADTSAHIIMDGYATGTFTFNVDQYTGDTVTASTTFKDIPTTADTNVTMDVQSDISTLSSMQIDKNGDGTIDATLAPKLGDTVTLDTTPPEPTVSSSGSRGGGGRRAATPITAPAPVAIAMDSTTSTSSGQASSQPSSETTAGTAPQANTPKVVAITKPVQVKKTPMAVASPKKVNTNVPQTASVYDSSQQPIFARMGRAVYNSLHGFWVAFKSLF